MPMTIRIRSAFLLAFLAIGLLPVITFTWMTYQRTAAYELKEVKERNLLLAESVAESLHHYEEDVRTVVNATAASLQQNVDTKYIQRLMENLNIDDVSIVSPDYGKILFSTNSKRAKNLEFIDPKLLEKIKNTPKSSKLQFLPVQKSRTGSPTIHVIRNSGDNFVIGCISTEYFVDMAKKVSFGRNGHAAIVDQAGNVLAHPNQAWANDIKNISEVSAVKRMMNGEAGIENFYSPATQSDMIAGISSVEDSGWGVMVPQELSEVRARIFENLTPLFIGLIGSVIAAILLLYFSIRWLAKPLENLAVTLKKQSTTGRPMAVSPSQAETSIHELTHIVDAYNELTATVLQNSEQLAKQIFEDALTGIGNRAYFESKSKKQIETRVSQGRKGILIFFDLDGFKEINDIRGHGIGDEVLKSFAKSLYPTTKKFMDVNFRGLPSAHPVIARIGGDEFAILLPLPDTTTNISEVCENLRKSFPKQINVAGVEIACDQSAGGALYPDHGTNIEDLLRRSDVALYKAKADGKNRFQLYSTQGALGGKSEILAAVLNAIENDELYLEYQPKFCLTKQQVTSAEALVRWQHPIHGIIQPNLFLPAVQQTHVMKHLGEWVIGRALRDINYFDEQGFNLNIAINIGTEHFSADSFIPNLIEQTSSAKINPSRMQIEITENVMDASRGVFNETVNALQEKGFTVAIDDFGRGFSNLTRLASIPVDLIKLDGSLIRGAINDPRVKVIMQTAIEMAHSLGSQVAVEGVETLEQVLLAEKSGADVLQGFYYSRSMTPENFTSWVKKRSENSQHSQVEKIRKSFEA
ncbi:EAL domain-containing protein [Ahrensia kielensis]|uniref:EAL domain-containing protein n=1 Tax=Ahrensia kielensis TaxID=76980 RepID=A0ABU9T232_9HYPH